MPFFEVSNRDGKWEFEADDDDGAYDAWRVDHAGDADQSVVIRPLPDPPLTAE